MVLFNIFTICYTIYRNSIICSRYIIIKYIHNRNYNNYDFFESPKSTVQFTNDGTQLYGSLFLDKLNNVVTNMTDPPIKYDTKRFELFRYSDILL